MTFTQKVVLSGLLCVGLAGCGGASSEIKPATTVPKVDPQKLEDFKKQSMQKGNLKVDPAKPAESGQPSGQ